MTSRGRASRFAAIGGVLAAIIIGTFGGFGAKTVAQVVADNAIENARAEREAEAEYEWSVAVSAFVAVAEKKVQAASQVNRSSCFPFDYRTSTCPSGIGLAAAARPEAPSWAPDLANLILPTRREQTVEELLRHSDRVESYAQAVSARAQAINDLCSYQAPVMCTASTTTVPRTTTASEAPFSRTGDNVGTGLERRERRQRELVDTYEDCRPTGQSSSWSGETLYCTLWGVYDDGTEDKIRGRWSN